MVPRRRADLFRLLCDLEVAAAYRPELSRIQVVTPHAFGHGTRWLETHTPRAGPFRLRATTRCEVVEFEPPTRLVIARTEGRRRSLLSFRFVQAGPVCRIEMDAHTIAPTPRAARRWARRLERFDETLMSGLREVAVRRLRRNPKPATRKRAAARQAPKRMRRKAKAAKPRPRKSRPATKRRR